MRRHSPAFNKRHREFIYDRKLRPSMLRHRQQNRI